MRVYKYLSDGAAKIFLEKGTLRFTQPRLFNDPFEILPAIRSKTPISNITDMRFCFSDNERDIQEYLIDSKKLEEYNNSIDPEEFLRPLYDSIGVLCLTQSKDSIPLNLLMWAHYARHHKGIVLEFDCSHEFFAHKASVIYCKDRPVLDAEIFREEKSIPLPALYIKSDHWKDEDELRVTRYLNELTEGEPDQEKNKVFLKKVPIDAVKRVFLGCCASNELIDLAQKFEREKGVNTIKLKMDKTTFSLTIDPQNSQDIKKMSDQILSINSI